MQFSYFVAVLAVLPSIVSAQNCCRRVRISVGNNYPHANIDGLYQFNGSFFDGKEIYENSAGFKMYFQKQNSGGIELNSWHIGYDTGEDRPLIKSENLVNSCPPEVSTWQTDEGTYTIDHVVNAECEATNICCTSVFVPSSINGGFFFQTSITKPDGIHARNSYISQDGKLELLYYEDPDSPGTYDWTVISINSGSKLYSQTATDIDTQCPEEALDWEYGEGVVVCGTPGPTTSPSISPTSSLPSVSPTISPTTSNPTLSPSTSDPTMSPSVSPTTSDPTTSPTISPTTSNPTISPSVSPTTSDPTLSPSVSPTTSSPTTSPTISPTTSTPSISPSISPTTSDPTTSPTISPTTSNPTTSPTISPTTSTPTISPSVSPTTSNPTLSPSISPTTSTPSISPSVSPTTSNPTVSPSVSPTTSDPTISPSISPTSNLPSISPTVSPTQSPTVTVAPTRSPTISPTISPTLGVCSLLCATDNPIFQFEVCGIVDKQTYATACEACQAGNGAQVTEGKCTTVPPTTTPTISPSTRPTSSPTPNFCSRQDYAACFEGHDCEPIQPCDSNLGAYLAAEYPDTCSTFAAELQKFNLGLVSNVPTQVSCPCLQSITVQSDINRLKCIPTSTTYDCPHSLFEDRSICNILDHTTDVQWRRRDLCEENVVLKFGPVSFGACAMATDTAVELHPHIVLLSNDVGGKRTKYFSYNSEWGRCSIHNPQMDRCSSWSAVSDSTGFFELVDGTDIQIWENNAGVATPTSLSSRQEDVRCNHNEISKSFLLGFNASDDYLKLCNEILATESCQERDSHTQECIRILNTGGYTTFAQPGGDGRMYRPQDIVTIDESTNLTEAAEKLMSRKPVDIYETPLECRGGSEYCEHIPN